MVTKKTVDGKTVFVCDICGLGYLDRKTAHECEDWCGKNPENCSLQISQKAVYSRDIGFMFPNKIKK
jgi:hypothetical protein